MRPLYFIPSIIFAACAAPTEPYFNQENAVQVTGVDVDVEVGNVGGTIVNISGSGFGNDPKAVTVVFGNLNAEVQSAEDGNITVVSPVGPVSGGAVDIRVGTQKGVAVLEDGFSYQIPNRGLLGQDSLDNQIAYISVSNDSLSCYGGLNSGIGGCEGFAYTGEAGVEGRSEGLEFRYPKGHMPYIGGKGGFGNQTDISWEKWYVTASPKDIISIDDEGAVEDRRIDIGQVTLKNPALEGSGVWCPNLPSLASFHYTGNDPIEELSEYGYVHANSTLAPPGDLSTYFGANGDCYDASRPVDLGELKYCQVSEYLEGNTLVYEADWPIEQSFFRSRAPGSTTLRQDIAIPLQINVENANITNRDITLPPYAQFLSVKDNGPVVMDSLDAECPSTDDDASITINDAVMQYEWEPIVWDGDCRNNNGEIISGIDLGGISEGVEDEEADILCPGDVKSVSSYVKVNILYFSLGWFGGEGTPIKSTITIPDNYNYDSETGKSRIDIPSWVVYSMPSADQDYGYTQGAGIGAGQTWTGYGDSSFQEYGLVVITMDRITEYTFPVEIDTISGDATLNGDVTFAYSTGDMGFFSFDNPLEETDPCKDCFDNDGDGWTDELDPDCDIYGEELFETTASTCNDGIDNDSNGLTDADDPTCTTGNSGESVQCSDNVDNDGDGWKDQEDPDCMAGIFESNVTFGQSTCNDGIDNDEDGWTDGTDIACAAASDSEDDGFSGSPCNDGIDNDGHGDIDIEDLYCLRNGADADAEAPTFIASCADEEDNDEDGFIDGDDPDCEFTIAVENATSTQDGDENYVGTCYDGIDNDCNGLVDAQDPACQNEDGVADGFLNAEVIDETTCTCGDGLDNDEDGWTDIDDPGCGSTTYAPESDGFSDSYECNDGIDNDEDGAIDSADISCISQSATATESRSLVSTCADEEDNDEDGWIDAGDLGCEFSLISEDPENYPAFEEFPEYHPECYNGTDDDGDGFADFEDTDCDNAYDSESASE